MCGRYVLYNTKRLKKRFNTNNDEDSQPLYNVAPGYRMPTITRNSPNKAVLMKWGLIPFWAKDPKIGYRMINARAESINEKPAFRKPFASQRCLIPADGFYEWHRTSTKLKIPYYFYLKNKDLFAFAGLYDVWKNPEGEEIMSYTLITTNSNDLVGKIHDRMPVILKKEDEDKWLDKDIPAIALLDLLKPLPSRFMEAYPVSSEVNSAKNESPDLIKPANPLLKL